MLRAILVIWGKPSRHGEYKDLRPAWTWVVGDSRIGHTAGEECGDRRDRRSSQKSEFKCQRSVHHRNPDFKGKVEIGWQCGGGNMKNILLKKKVAWGKWEGAKRSRIAGIRGGKECSQKVISWSDFLSHQRSLTPHCWSFSLDLEMRIYISL